ncbi:MAG TPA: thiamine-phosphate kinase [Oculatellaceae cyanobacterium]
MTQEHSQEHSIVQQIKTWTNSRFIGDDCAMLPRQQLATTDSLIEGTHFLTSVSSFEDIGWKSVAVNLSDIAAMGGYPEYLLVAISLPAQFTREQFSRLYSGIIDCANTFKTRVAGGDLTAGPNLVLSLTALGSWHENGCLTRSGAKDGDLVIATGDFGASAAGLWYLRNNSQSIPGAPPCFPHAAAAHRRPQPKLTAGWALVKRTASEGALMDASDGLADALVQIAHASNVSMDIDLSSVPVHEETRNLAGLAGVDPLHWALYGGEDYQLVGCLRKEIWDNWEQELATHFVVIGRVSRGRGVNLRNAGKEGAKLDLDNAFQQIHF